MWIKVSRNASVIDKQVNISMSCPDHLHDGKQALPIRNVAFNGNDFLKHLENKNMEIVSKCSWMMRQNRRR